ncbi:MAG TPA: hypothetical protein VNO13_07045 [Candidatus Udaeobacter sp.]|nr:hypothetical protein [Candidatus Udaeobacter sp.]
MSEPQRSRSIGRSIGAVLAGIFAGAILSLGTDEVLHAVGVFPPWGQPVTDAPLLLATAYRIVFEVAGCYIAARFAPSRPMLHALLAGFVGFVLSIVGAVATWNGGPAFGPHWYPVSLVITAIPCAWLGGKLRLMQVRERINV